VKPERLLALLAATLLVGCSGGTNGNANLCSSLAQCPAPSNGTFYLCLGLCDGNSNDTASFLADGGIAFELLSDGGLLSSCPSGNVTNATCVATQCGSGGCQ
jgi:hypothetical protein